MKVFKEKAGVISENPVWIMLHDGYIYTGDTLLKLLILVIREYKHDRHMVG